jgi:hypothetical protein
VQTLTTVAMIANIRSSEMRGSRGKLNFISGRRAGERWQGTHPPKTTGPVSAFTAYKPYRAMRLLPVLLFFIALRTAAQSPGESSAPATAALAKPSRYLALDVVGGLGGFHRFRYFAGDPISFRIRTDGAKYRAKLTETTDSSFSVLLDNELMGRAESVPFRFADIASISAHRQIPFVTTGSVLLPVAGLVYILADFINSRNIDGSNGQLRFDPNSLIPGGALILGGGICYKLSNRTYRINDRHRLRFMQAL